MGADFNSSITHIDKQMLREAMHKVDLLLRPNIVFVNPKDNFLKAVPDLTDEFLLEESAFIEQGKAIVINRKELERWGKYD